MPENRIRHFFEREDCIDSQSWELLRIGCDEGNTAPNWVADRGCDLVFDEVMEILDKHPQPSRVTDMQSLHAEMASWFSDPEDHIFPLSSVTDSVTAMTEQLFPGCAVESECVDGKQFGDEPHVLVRVLWNDSAMTEPQKHEALATWHSQVFSVAPELAAGTYRLEVEYPE